MIIVYDGFQYRTIGRMQKTIPGIDIRTARRKSNRMPIQKLCKIFEALAASKKIKKKLIRKKKNNVQDRNKTPPRYFNRREISPNIFKKLFMLDLFVTTSSCHH